MTSLGLAVGCSSSTGGPTGVCNLECVETPIGCTTVGTSGAPCNCPTWVCPDGGPATDVPGDTAADARSATDTGTPADTGATGDAGSDAAPDVPTMCAIDCAPPPAGCSYPGPVTCDPPSCGPLVCADAGTAVDAGAVVCTAGGPDAFPTFARSCATDTDCFVALHQTDCCGSERALGLSVSERAAFATDEALCEGMYPGCGCAAQPTVTDDGRHATGAAAIQVHCVTGTCTTTVP